MGRAAPRPGQQPFRLDLDFLLTTRSGLGDVLAKLLDLAHSPANGAWNGHPAGDLAGIPAAHLAFEAEYDRQKAAARSEAA
jgi:hypothetical protein